MLFETVFSSLLAYGLYSHFFLFRTKSATLLYCDCNKLVVLSSQ